MSAAVAAAAAAAASVSSKTTSSSHHPSNQAPNHGWIPFFQAPAQRAPLPALSRYESQKRRDWKAFVEYLKKHRPQLGLSRCTGVHVLEFLDYQFGNTKLHRRNCPFWGNPPDPPSPCSCSCPLDQAWSSLDGVVGRLRVAFEENGGQPETNPFSAHVVRLYLRDLRDAQAKARGIAYTF